MNPGLSVGSAAVAVLGVKIVVRFMRKRVKTISKMNFDTIVFCFSFEVMGVCFPFFLGLYMRV